MAQLTPELAKKFPHMTSILVGCGISISCDLKLADQFGLGRNCEAGGVFTSQWDSTINNYRVIEATNTFSSCADCPVYRSSHT